jgi:hypothetical protein
LLVPITPNYWASPWHQKAADKSRALFCFLKVLLNF